MTLPHGGEVQCCVSDRLGQRAVLSKNECGSFVCQKIISFFVLILEIGFG